MCHEVSGRLQGPGPLAFGHCEFSGEIIPGGGGGELSYERGGDARWKY